MKVHLLFFFWQHSLFLYHVFCYAGAKGETGVEQNMPGWFRTNGIRAKVLMDVSKRDLGNTRIKRKGEVLGRVFFFFWSFKRSSDEKSKTALTMTYHWAIGH